MSVGPRRGPVAGRQGALRCATSTHDHELAADRTQPREATNVNRLGLETCRSTKGQQLPTCSSAHRAGTIA